LEPLLAIRLSDILVNTSIRVRGAVRRVERVPATFQDDQTSAARDRSIVSRVGRRSTTARDVTARFPTGRAERHHSPLAVDGPLMSSAFSGRAPQATIW